MSSGRRNPHQSIQVLGGGLSLQQLAAATNSPGHHRPGYTFSVSFPPEVEATIAARVAAIVNQRSSYRTATLLALSLPGGSE